MNVDRYLLLGHPGRSPLSFTEHSRLAPLFFQQVVFFEGQYPWLASEFEKRLREAKSVVFSEHRTGPQDGQTQAVLDAEYEALPRLRPRSAAELLYKIYIRRSLPLQ